MAELVVLRIIMNIAPSLLRDQVCVAWSLQEMSSPFLAADKPLWQGLDKPAYAQHCWL